MNAVARDRVKAIVRSRWFAVLTDVALAVAAVIDVIVVLPGWTPPETALAAIAVAGLLVRRRLPWVAFILALPGLVIDAMTIAAPIALYSVAVRERRTPPLVAAGAITFACFLLPDWQLPELDYLAPSLLYALLYAATPLALGALVRTRRELSERVADLSAARESQRRRDEEDALRRERARLSREMHDVVSHQASLIAVQAGALQVASTDPEARRIAGVIRSLAVRTLDELRQMIGVLRAEGAPTPGEKPQPTLHDLPRLVSDSGIEVELVTDLAGEVAPALQRAIYRVVQEGLTNAHKHAPGARVSVEVRATISTLDVVVRNEASAAEALPLPSGGAGLRGLRERAELLGGRLEAAREDDGGFRLAVSLPRREPER